MDEAAADAPQYLEASMRWIQFESTLPLRLSPWADQAPHRDHSFREFAWRAKRHCSYTG